MSEPATMRTLRFHSYGEPADVLRLERAPVPSPAAGRVRAVVHACGLNPADWSLCRGLFPGQLPRGVGLDVAGVVDAVGEGVTDIAIGDRVVGNADFRGSSSAGASGSAILDYWARLPAPIDFVQAAALPMAVETAYRHVDAMGLAAGQCFLVHGAGSSIGFAAVQIARMRGANVIATAGETYAERLRATGARVTSYGEGMVGRIEALAAGAVDLALDTSPASPDPARVNKLVEGQVEHAHGPTPTGDPLADLVRAAGGDPGRVVTVSHFESAAKLGVRTTFDLLREVGPGPRSRPDVLREFVQLAAEGRFTVPVARTFALDDWREALATSLSGKARGKLVLRCHTT